MSMASTVVGPNMRTQIKELFSYLSQNSETSHVREFTKFPYFTRKFDKTPFFWLLFSHFQGLFRIIYFLKHNNARFMFINNDI